MKQPILIAGLVLLLAACSSAPPSPTIRTTAPAKASVAVAVLPSPAIAQRTIEATEPPTQASATPTPLRTISTATLAQPTTASTSTTVPTAPPPTASPATIAPTAPRTNAQPTNPAIGPHYVAHIVGAHETVNDLSRRGFATDAIRRYNHLRDGVRPGQPLLIETTDQSITGTRVVVDRGNPTQPRVALTFDAGASAAPTAKLLAALRERGIRVTFFLTGEWMQDNPELLKQIVADGHEIANHSFSHPDFTKLDDATIGRELDATEQIAQHVGGVSTRPYFRPPFGAYNKHILDLAIEAGYLPIAWTFDSLDSVGPPKSPQFLIDRVTTHLSGAQLNGAIILMHVGSDATAQAVPTILDRFAAQGVKVTTISEVLGP